MFSPLPLKQTGEITNLAGCDFLTISPALLKELQNSTEDLPRVLSPEKAGQAEPMSKTSFIDNEPAFRWSLVQDPMANEKLTEGESSRRKGHSVFQAYYLGHDYRTRRVSMALLMLRCRELS